MTIDTLLPPGSYSLRYGYDGRAALVPESIGGGPLPPYVQSPPLPPPKPEDYLLQLKEQYLSYGLHEALAGLPVTDNILTATFHTPHRWAAPSAPTLGFEPQLPKGQPNPDLDTIPVNISYSRRSSYGGGGNSRVGSRSASRNVSRRNSFGGGPGPGPGMPGASGNSGNGGVNGTLDVHAPGALLMPSGGSLTGSGAVTPAGGDATGGTATPNGMLTPSGGSLTIPTGRLSVTGGSYVHGGSGVGTAGLGLGPPGGVAELLAVAGTGAADAAAAAAVAALSGKPGSDVAWSEAPLNTEQRARRAAAREAGGGGGGPMWQGFAVSVPYMPGGVQAASATAASAAAARQAMSGAWLEEIESGRLSRTCAPGLSSGLWGAWAEQDGHATASNHGTYPGLQPTARLPASTSSSSVTTTPAAASKTTSAAVAVANHAPRTSLAAVLQPGGATAGGAGGSAGGGMFGDVLFEDEDEPTVREESMTLVPSALSLVTGPTEESTARPTTSRVSDTGFWQAPDPLENLLAQSGTIGAAATAVVKGPRKAAGRPPAAATHQWAVRGALRDVAAVNAAFDAHRPRLALQYPFELDTFQKEAVVHLEAGHSVFVAAHTSAGKTAVAEYAFALATRHCSRAIYTSPIKTISNQKFRDFGGRFDVGLLTGDAQIKPTASCLIMTTEILRSMLYKGADVIRDVEWVVFDEVHYVNDAERGVVWEEVIIMLPPHINLVLLSATVPNVMDFADWVGRTKRKVVHVTGTLKRPVPLEHMLYYASELYPVCSRDVFNPEGVRKALSAYKQRNAVPETKTQEKAQRPTGRGDGPGGPNKGGGAAAGGNGGGGRGFRQGGSADKARQQLQASGRSGGPNSGQGRTQLAELVQLLTQRAMLPAAVFTFSKKRCDAAADALSGIDLTTSVDKHAIHVFVEKCLSRLKEEDRRLPQILRLRELMRRGLAVHHAGLLPIMKEVVELLFCQGYIKVLFCTETFAMGVNAPTRTVVFHDLRKHDGRNFRLLMPGEYTQMAGRAGRRGLDAVGHVLIACWDEVWGETDLRSVLMGHGVALESRFRLTYSMILGLLRVEDLKVEDMLKRSFAEFHAQKAQPQAVAAARAIDAQLAAVESTPWPDCYSGCSRADVEQYYALSQRIAQLTEGLQATLVANKAFQTSLVPGRLVQYQNPINGLSELAVVLADAPATAATASAPPTTGGTVPSSSSASPRSATAAPAAPPRSPAAGGGGDVPLAGDRKVYLLVLHRPGPADDEAIASSMAAAEAAAVRKAAEDADFGGGMRRIRKKGFGDEPVVLDPGPLPHYGEEGGMHFLIIAAWSRQLTAVCKTKVKVNPERLLSGQWESGTCRSALAAALLAVRTAQEETPSGEPPVLDPRSDFKMSGIEEVTAMLERSNLLAQRAAMRPHRCPSLAQQYNLVRKAVGLRAAREQLTHSLSDASLQQMPEFGQRVAVLQALGYLDAERVVSLKGRVLCEINSTQAELVTTELLFAGILSELTPAQAVALLSCLVFQEKSDVIPSLPEPLSLARDELLALTRQCAAVQRQHGLDVPTEEYVTEVLHTGLMEVVHEWALGTPFEQICELTDVMEGSIVRCVVRLDQACRELMDAARVMGNTALFTQMSAASAAIKRDVVFAASLYVAA